MLSETTAPHRCSSAPASRRKPRNSRSRASMMQAPARCRRCGCCRSILLVGAEPAWTPLPQLLPLRRNEECTHTRPRTQSVVVSLHSLRLFCCGREQSTTNLDTLKKSQARPSPAQPNPRTRLRRERPFCPTVTRRLGGPFLSTALLHSTGVVEHGCRSRGAELWDTTWWMPKTKTPRAGLAYVWSLGVVGTSGGVELSHQWRYKEGR